MKKTYKNKMVTSKKDKRKKSIVLIPKYVGSGKRYFPQYKKQVGNGDLLPEMPIKEAKARQDFVLIKKEK